QAIGQRGGAGLQDQRRLYLVEIAVLHRRQLRKTWPRRHPLGSKLLAAPGPDDQVRAPLDDLLARRYPVLGRSLPRAVGKNVDAARRSISSETQPIAEISGSSHSSKNTSGRLGRAAARARAAAKPAAN